VGLKGDLGALILGSLIASHPKAEEMAKTMLSFKDLFLLGLFLSIGMSGQLSLEILAISALITPFVLFKSALFFSLLSGFKLRARTSLLASLNLTNFSEFGLIVAAVGVANGWIDNDWLMVLALCLSLSFVISAVLNANANWLYTRHGTMWRRLERSERLADDRPIDIDRVTVIIIGMGRVGTGAYDKMRDLYGDAVVGVDIDPITVQEQRSTGRKVLSGDPSDADFWDRVQASHTLELVMLTLPKLSTNLAVLEQLEAASFSGQVAATARFSDEVEALQRAGASAVFNIYGEAGAGFAAQVVANERGKAVQP
jgi:hypothetical protein